MGARVGLAAMVLMGSITAAAAQDASPPPSRSLAEATAPFVQLALDCAGQEYPNQIAHTMQSDLDRGTPRSLHPAFYGCFDWHSSVHGHWLLAAYAHRFPGEPLAADARRVLAAHLAREPIAAEAAYLAGEGRASWERPYGLAWLLQLASELHGWDDAEARSWRAALAPLEAACVERLEAWLPKLAYPIRTGEHSQTAFAFGLVLDYARAVGDTTLASLVEATSRRLYLADRGADLAFEPSGQDFLSPALAEAALMARVLPAPEFAGWLTRFLPEIPFTTDTGWLPVAEVTDRSDGKLAHLDGLNLSRAWMLSDIRDTLPGGDLRRVALARAAADHLAAGLQGLALAGYEGGHWLGTYAMYAYRHLGE
ncbi:MAG: DUF2891 domain-containing protein [Candidatus Krumholzibacteriia bacterium]